MLVDSSSVLGSGLHRTGPTRSTGDPSLNGEAITDELGSGNGPRDCTFRVLGKQYSTLGFGEAILVHILRGFFREEAVASDIRRLIGL